MQELEGSVFDLDEFRRGTYDVNCEDVYRSPDHRVRMWTVREGGTIVPTVAGSERLLILMGGIGELITEGGSRAVEDGAMIVVPPGARHEVRNASINTLTVLSIERPEK